MLLSFVCHGAEEGFVSPSCFPPHHPSPSERVPSEEAQPVTHYYISYLRDDDQVIRWVL